MKPLLMAGFLLAVLFLQSPSFAQDTEEYRSDTTHLKLTTNVETISSGTVMLKAKVDWMVCEKTCIPETAELSLSLPANLEINTDE